MFEARSSEGTGGDVVPKRRIDPGDAARRRIAVAVALLVPMMLAIRAASERGSTRCTHFAQPACQASAASSGRPYVVSEPASPCTRRTA